MKTLSFFKFSAWPILLFSVLILLVGSCSEDGDSDPIIPDPVSQQDIPLIDSKIEAFLTAQKSPEHLLPFPKTGNWYTKKATEKLM
jgi:hypothetical protein